MRIVLLTPSRRFIANRFGLGYQVPLGLVLIGGPLVDAGHQVRLIDNDLHGWPTNRLVAEIAGFGADCVMLGHTGSTAAHHVCLADARAIRAALPAVKIVYGGVYPTYAAEASLRDCPAIDVVVRGEGEDTCRRLAAAFERGTPLADVPGITWREGASLRANRPAPPIASLDDYRPGWELVEFERYTLFGLGRSAGMQLSRGCPLSCTYCGQWMFWRRWRHRSPAGFVAELQTLAEQYGVKVVWLADENFAADRAVVREVLERLVAADLGLSLNVNMTAADVVRDADLLPLYKAAGVEYVVMGVEAVDDALVAAVRKNNPFALSKQAVAALRRNGIVSLVNIIYGLGDESLETLASKLRKVVELDPDVLNAVYLTPHFWTPDGRATDPAEVIQPNMARWTYRNQVVRAPRLSPWALFAGIKLTEALFHLRPRALARLFVGDEPRVRQIRRASLAVGLRTVLAEIAEMAFATRFAPTGSFERLPGAPSLPRRVDGHAGRGAEVPEPVAA
jgi:anaerobic magnesium-protoporphyrin IX monomethyl ester cyclase